MKGPPTIESTGRPWFGPTARAREFLSKHRTSVVKPKEAARRLCDLLGSASAGVEHVRFVDFFHSDKRFRFTIAICWTYGDFEVRQDIYDLAAQFVAETGWYLLPQGERLSSVRQAHDVVVSGRRRSFPSFGNAGLSCVSAAARAEDGCSLRVALNNGSAILLDTGLPQRITPSTQDALALITHVHLDHLGGVVSGRLPGMPVVLSVATAHLLQAAGRLRPIEDMNPVYIVAPGETVSLGDRLRLQAVAVPHMPGSVGFILTDDKRALFYSGDISLVSSRHDFMPELNQIAGATPGMVVLLDATMAGRAGGASRFDPGKVVAEQDANDVVILAESGEHLVYAYLDLFHRIQGGSRRHSVTFLVTADLRAIFAVLHDAFIRRDHRALDRFLLAQYGRSMSSWGESRWLLWLDRATVIPPGRHIWFVTPSDFQRHHPSATSIVVPIGRVSAPAGHRTIDVDTTPWTLHSSEDALVDGVRTLERAGARVGLFHNFAKRTKKFLKEHGLRASVIDDTPFLL